MYGVVGFAAGVGFLALVWFPHSIVEWFIASLVPGLIAGRLAIVPEGHSPSRAFGVFAGLWVALFFVPIAVAIGQQVGVLPTARNTPRASPQFIY